MVSQPYDQTDLIADLVRAKRRLIEIEAMPGETISDRIARTKARCQARYELAQLEARAAAVRQRNLNAVELKYATRRRV